MRNSHFFSLQKKGEILSIKLFSQPLEGLTKKDFDLVMNINKTHCIFLNTGAFPLQILEGIAENQINALEPIDLRIT